MDKYSEVQVQLKYCSQQRQRHIDSGNTQNNKLYKTEEKKAAKKTRH